MTSTSCSCSSPPPTTTNSGSVSHTSGPAWFAPPAKSSLSSMTDQLSRPWQWTSCLVGSSSSCSSSPSSPGAGGQDVRLECGLVTHCRSLCWRRGAAGRGRRRWPAACSGAAQRPPAGRSPCSAGSRSTYSGRPASRPWCSRRGRPCPGRPAQPGQCCALLQPHLVTVQLAVDTEVGAGQTVLAPAAMQCNTTAGPVLPVKHRVSLVSGISVFLPHAPPHLHRPGRGLPDSGQD